MPKPMFGDNGSGMHVHQSIWNGSTPVFAGNKYADLSETCLCYIAGILKHAKTINAFTNPTTNSYKRLVPGYEAPVLLAYSARNRSASCRIPHVTEPEGEARRGPLPRSRGQSLSRLRRHADGRSRRHHQQAPSRARRSTRTCTTCRRPSSTKIPTVCGSLREALDSLDKDRAFLKMGGVMTDDMIDAYIELKMAEKHALRDDAASGRVRHVLLGLVTGLAPGTALGGRSRGRPLCVWAAPSL